MDEEEKTNTAWADISDDVKNQTVMAALEQAVKIVPTKFAEAIILKESPQRNHLLQIASNFGSSDKTQRIAGIKSLLNFLVETSKVSKSDVREFIRENQIQIQPAARVQENKSSQKEPKKQTSAKKENFTVQQQQELKALAANGTDKDSDYAKKIREFRNLQKKKTPAKAGASTASKPIPVEKKISDKGDLTVSQKKDSPEQKKRKEVVTSNSGNSEGQVEPDKGYTSAQLI